MNCAQSTFKILLAIFIVTNALKTFAAEDSKRIAPSKNVAADFGEFPLDNTWNPEKEIPAPVFIGPSTPMERNMADEVRQGLVNSLAFWQKHGLPNPPDVEGFYIVTDVRDMKVSTVLSLFNPDISDIKEHMKLQMAHLASSRLMAFVVKFGSRFLGAETEDELAELKKTMTAKFFEMYASRRYMFTVPNLFEAVEKDWTVRQALEKKGEEVPTYPMQDNAFYARFLRFDLSEILPLSGPLDFQAFDDLILEAQKEMDMQTELEGKTESIAPHQPQVSKKKMTKKVAIRTVLSVGLTYVARNIARLIDFQKFQNLTKMANRKSPRIVILPRSEQETLGAQISTLGDASVSKHELGHHMGHTIHDSIHRLIDEVLADYLAAAPEANPKIGDFFAKSSGIIAQSLMSREERTHEQWLMAESFARVAERGLLRDLSDVTNIDQISRKYLQANDYDAGDPLRTFLWQLRFSSQLPSEVVDKMVIQVLGELNHLPAMISNRSNYVLQARQAMSYIRKAWMAMRVKSHLSSWAESHQQEEIESLANEKLKTELEHIQTQLDLAISKGRASAGSKIELSEKQIKVLRVKARAEAKKEYMEAQTKIIEATANGVVSDLLHEKESRETQKRLFWRKIGFGARPAIQADYVVPEFLRAMYRVSQLQSEEAQRAVRHYAEQAMNSSSIVVSVEGHRSELVFMKSPLSKFAPALRARLNKIMKQLAELRSEHRKIIKDYEDGEIKDESREAIKNLYSVQLERLQEFERTGSMYRLYVAHPVMTVSTATLRWIQSLRKGDTTPISCAKVLGSEL